MDGHAVFVRCAGESVPRPLVGYRYVFMETDNRSEIYDLNELFFASLLFANRVIA